MKAACWKRRVSALTVAMLAGSAWAQGFPISMPQVHRTSLHGDASGVYLTTSTIVTRTDPMRSLQVLHYDGRAFSTLGCEQFGGVKPRAAMGTSVTRTASGDVVLRGDCEFDDWVEPCVMRRRGERWEVAERNNANAVQVVSVGDRVLSFGGSPRSMGSSTSGLFELTADGQWRELGVHVAGPGGRPQPGSVYSAAIVGNKAYFVGYFTRAGGVPCRDLVCLDGPSGAWTAIPPPYPEPSVNGIGQVGEPRGTLDDVAVTSDGKIFVLGRRRDLFGYNDQALSVYENGAWRTLGKVESNGELLHRLVLVAAESDVFALGSFDTLLGERCDGFAKWNGTRFVAAGKRRGIWSFPDSASGGPAQLWAPGLRQIMTATGGWPGRIVALRQGDSASTCSELAVFDIANDDWVPATGERVP